MMPKVTSSPNPQTPALSDSVTTSGATACGTMQKKVGNKNLDNSTNSNEEDTNAERAIRTAFTTNYVIKEEDPDVEYDSLLAPAIIRPKYNTNNDVKSFSINNSNPKTSRAPTRVNTSHNKQLYQQ